MTPILCVRNVDACYGSARVLEGVSLSVRPGQFLALIGPNGSGKTTLSRIICRIKKPSAGTVELEGGDIWRIRSAEFSRSVAHVRQSERIAWPFTVEQVVRMGRFVHRGWVSPYTEADRTAVERALQMTDLAGLRERTLDTLSGGEAQRAIIARAIAQEPRLLLLDEPVAHLDIRHQLEVLNTIRSFVAGGLTVVVCLHDLTLTALYADRVALLQAGKLRSEGPPEAVLNEADLEDVYGTPVHVGRFPGTDKLRISPIPHWAGRHELKVEDL